MPSPQTHHGRKPLPTSRARLALKRLSFLARPASSSHSPIIGFLIQPKTPIMTLSHEDMDLIFRNARTQNGWKPKPVSDAQLRELYELMKWAPTTMNTNPARILFLCSQEAKARLKPALSPGNVDKTMAAPVTAIIAYDTQFYELLPKLFPHNQNARGIFAGEEKKAHTERTAFRNGSMQGGYFRSERARHIRRRREEGAYGEDCVSQRFDAGRLF